LSDNADKNWHSTFLCINPMINEMHNFIRKKLQEWFRKSELKEELMSYVWHPRYFEKFKYLDPEVFGELLE
jgi:hypothetical protein